MAEIRGRGRKGDQKMKPYLVYDYLMRNSDENHVVSASEICGYLEEMGISAERRSIYKDIEEINKAILLIDAAAEDVYEAEEMCEDEEERTILYDSHRKGFYVRQRKYDASDIRFLAESVYTARFIDAMTSKRLIGVLGALVSEHEHKNITHDVFLTDRVKTDNTSVFNNINTITSAMARELDGEKHVPEKIKFKYLYRDIQNYKVYTERGKGAEYVVSPFMLLVSEGFYYLLAFDDAKQKMRTFRVDRMKGVKYTGIPREGEEEFKKIRLEDYALSHFGMFEGEREHVTMRFASHMLDAVVDRFGTDAVYNKVDSKHFSVTVSVAVSKQFYGWLCGFGNLVKVLSPSHVVDDFKAHLDKVASLYGND
jgi:predicted DNA-binding transcriptional regulator YafY